MAPLETRPPGYLERASGNPGGQPVEGLTLVLAKRALPILTTPDELDSVPLGYFRLLMRLLLLHLE